MLRIGVDELNDRSDLQSPDGNHANEPKQIKLLAESKFAWKKTKKQMSWVKLSESKKSWQKYHSEDLSKTNVANNKPDLANPSAASSQKNMRLKSEFGSSNETLSQKLSNYFSDI